MRTLPGNHHGFFILPLCTGTGALPLSLPPYFNFRRCGNFLRRSESPPYSLSFFPGLCVLPLILSPFTFFCDLRYSPPFLRDFSSPAFAGAFFSLHSFCQVVPILPRGPAFFHLIPPMRCAPPSFPDTKIQPPAFFSLFYSHSVTFVT